MAVPAGFGAEALGSRALLQSRSGARVDKTAVPAGRRVGTGRAVARYRWRSAALPPSPGSCSTQSPLAGSSFCPRASAPRQRFAAAHLWLRRAAAPTDRSDSFCTSRRYRVHQRPRRCVRLTRPAAAHTACGAVRSCSAALAVVHLGAARCKAATWCRSAPPARLRPPAWACGLRPSPTAGIDRGSSWCCTSRRWRWGLVRCDRCGHKRRAHCRCAGQSLRHCPWRGRRRRARTGSDPSDRSRPRCCRCRCRPEAAWWQWLSDRSSSRRAAAVLCDARPAPFRFRGRPAQDRALSAARRWQSVRCCPKRADRWRPTLLAAAAARPRRPHRGLVG